MFRYRSAASISEASQNFTQKSYGLFDEVSRWVTHNSVDILVASAIGVLLVIDNSGSQRTRVSFCYAL